MVGSGGSPGPVRTPARGSTALPQRRNHLGVDGNERLTALAGAVLLVPALTEVATTPNLRALLSVHIFVGVLMAGPLAVKIGSTGYRFLRYYTGAPAFVRKGPPHLALRLLAPLLLLSTLVVIGSGIGLLVTGPTQPGLSRLFAALHVVSFLIWLPAIAIHAFAYIRRVPRLIADDWRRQHAELAPGRGLRLGVNLGAMLGVLIAAFLVYPLAAPWIAVVETPGDAPGPYFFIAAMIVTAFALLAARPLRWR